ncbi:SapC family protein [Pseudoduganella plicata]|uniref:Peptidase n=1 Tax=Pseudoduganella plicata TaxID=321984 RepID=A0A4V1AU11_9BURK|nr:SapC family protein [Pseudoduganella plicata]QBQ37548.1 peptidase [Pseudoduganella plicata]GGY91181.1 peptidase [Pseudoduganella plicata]
MPNPVLLNNVQHKDLRVLTQRSAALGDDVMFALTFPAEFRTLQAHYPIVFRKTDDATSFEPVALFGFQPGENLFLNDTGWDAPEVPLLIERQPFLIGRQGEELMVHIDVEHPRVGTHDGEPLFLEYGGVTPYLERINSVLLTIHQGLQTLPGFVKALLEHELLESFVFDIELDDGSQNRLAGFYTIHEERLAALDGTALGRLHRSGFLQPVYMAVASLSQFRALIARKNAARR